MTVYEADWICPVTGPPIRDAALAVQSGQIQAIGDQRDIPGGDRVSFPGCILIPGFVNAHAHLELTLFHGLLDGLSFADWIAKLVRIKYGMLSRDDIRLSARLGAMEMLQAGVTCVGEVMEAGLGWEVMREFGLQGVAYQEVFGPAESAAPDAMRELRKKVDQYRKFESDSQRVGISPHAPYTVSKTLYRDACGYARSEGLPMTAHIAESGDETLFVRDGRGPFAERHRQREIPVVARNCLPVAYLDGLGLLGPDMLLIHAIETDAADLSRIRAAGSPVVHCPRSNAILGHAVARVNAMKAMGVVVALGTDSTASNASIDMFEEMRLAMKQQRLEAPEALRMATIDGARSISLDRYLGSLEPGKRADFVVVELNATGNTDAGPIDTMISSATRKNVKATYLAGIAATLDETDAADVTNKIQKLRDTLSS